MGLGSIAFPLIRANGFVRMAKYIIKRNIVKGRGYCVQKIYLRSINGVTLYLYTSYFPTSDVNTKSKSLCNRSMYRIIVCIKIFTFNILCPFLFLVNGLSTLHNRLAFSHILLSRNSWTRQARSVAIFKYRPSKIQLLVM